MQSQINRVIFTVDRSWYGFLWSASCVQFETVDLTYLNCGGAGPKCVFLYNLTTLNMLIRHCFKNSHHCMWDVWVWPTEVSVKVDHHVQHFCVCVPPAHQGRVTVVLFVLEMEWLLSTGQDKNFTWHCSESGQQLGMHHTAAWVSGLQYPFMPPTPPLVCLLPR